MKKKIFIMAILLVLVGSCCTGCFKRDKMEDINIITTVYQNYMDKTQLLIQYTLMALILMNISYQIKNIKI